MVKLSALEMIASESYLLPFRDRAGAYCQEEIACGPIPEY